MITSEQEKIECQKGKNKETFYDTEISGFILEVRKTGNKTFYFSYTKDKKRTMKKLGDADTTTADQANRLP